MNFLTSDAVHMLIRLLVGLILIAHGARLATRPTQPPRAVYLIGLRPPAMWAVIIWASLIAGGLLLALGLLQPLGSALIAANMLVAVAFKRHRGYWNDQNGFEYPLVLTLLAALLGLTRPGAYALDTALGLPGSTGPWPALAAVAVVMGGALCARMLWCQPAASAAPGDHPGQAPGR